MVFSTPEKRRPPAAPPSGRKLGSPFVPSPLVSRVHARTPISTAASPTGDTALGGARAASADLYFAKRILSPFTAHATAGGARRPSSARNPAASRLSIPGLVNGGGSTMPFSEENPSWIRMGVPSARPSSALVEQAGRRALGGAAEGGRRARPQTARATMERRASSGACPHPMSARAVRPATATATLERKASVMTVTTDASGMFEGGRRPRSAHAPKDPASLPGRRVMRNLEGGEEQQWRDFKKVVRKRENYNDFAGWIAEVEGNLLGGAVKPKGTWDLTRHFLEESERDEEKESKKTNAVLQAKAEEEAELKLLAEHYREAHEQEKQFLRSLKHRHDESDDEIMEQETGFRCQFVNFYLETGICGALEEDEVGIVCVHIHVVHLLTSIPF